MNSPKKKNPTAKTGGQFDSTGTTRPKIPHRNLLRKIGDLAEQVGVDAYPVGGFVRDWLLERPILEIDLVVVGDGPDFARKTAEMLKLRRSKRSPKWPVIFEDFGTAMLHYRGIDIEFVGARKEAYRTSSRKPVVSPGKLKDDLLRRDFTVNTLAMSIAGDSFGEIIDHFGGLNDLQAKIIRTPGDPEKAFSDDPLRILRAVRFSCQLHFGISRPTLEAMSQIKERLSIVSQERITTELRKILLSDTPSVGIKLLYMIGVLDIILPELVECEGVETRGKYGHKDVLDHTLRVLDRVAELTKDDAEPELVIRKLEETLELAPVSEKREQLMWAALLHDIAKPRTKRFTPDSGWTFYGHEDVGARMVGGIGRTLKLPSDIVHRAQDIVRMHMRPIHLAEEGVTDSAIRRIIVEAGDDINALLTLCRADITSGNPRKVKRYVEAFNQLVERLLEVLEKDKLRAFQSPVRGDEIMELTGLSPGPMVGKLKKSIEEAILDGRIPNEYVAAKEYLLSIMNDILGPDKGK